MNQKLKQIFDTIKYDEKYLVEFKDAYLNNATFDKKSKIFSGVVCFLVTALIFGSLYVQWNPVGAQFIYGIQGR